MAECSRRGILAGAAADCGDDAIVRMIFVVR